MLTSGTTGPPKGARRPHPRSLSGLASVLDRIPLRPRETVLLSAPIFHTWGFGGLQLALAMRDTIVLQRRFDPGAARSALVEHHCQVLFAVPVMLQRMLALDTAPETALRIVAVSGSSLPGGLATRFMTAYGPVLYNVYGSTEVSWAAIADPRDLMAAPACSGRPPHGTRVVIVSQDGTEAPAGQVGRVFVGNEMLFSGYTDGGTRERWHGLVDTGDLGHVEDGRLCLDGREDDLVVSGGENVHVGEVEDVISGMNQVREATVFGVEDEEFGQRLVAYVVPEPGVRLVPADVVRVRQLPSGPALPPSGGGRRGEAAPERDRQGAGPRAAATARRRPAARTRVSAVRRERLPPRGGSPSSCRDAQASVAMMSLNVRDGRITAATLSASGR